ncbi:hypothetical protein [Halorubrum ezzemoulense]|uniref:Uncharacterized protein n=1 Tax=Halorubrum ezzemoulense TaxID=337243 RepID=A0A256JQ23_HALEZ|nr:hypothetical protein [Halorubrum ezzemoulense]OYR70327.1 hypothetical protein DJ78_08915 [Halorubrum ezzemoulense]
MAPDSGEEDEEDDEAYIGFNISSTEKQEWQDWVKSQRKYDTLTGLIKRAVRHQIAYDQDEGPWAETQASDSVEVNNVEAEVDLEPILAQINDLSGDLQQFHEEFRDYTEARSIVDDPTSDAFLSLLTNIRSLLPVASSEDEFIETISGYTAEPDSPEELAQTYGRVSDILNALLAQDYDALSTEDVQDACDLLAAREDDVELVRYRTNKHYVIING